MNPRRIRGLRLRASDVADETVEEVERACRAATPGPWMLSQDPGSELADQFVGRGRIVFSVDGIHYVNMFEPEVDLITGSRTMMPELVAEIRRARAPKPIRRRLEDDELARLEEIRVNVERTNRRQPWEWAWLGPEQLRRLAEACERAVPAPWRWATSPQTGEVTWLAGERAIYPIGDEKPSDGDAHFIVAARRYLARLVDCVRRQRRAHHRSQLWKLRAEIDRAWDRR